ncbi:hypothetical protein JCM11641_006490 [Rhodosporidiobolus odoratus]
MLSCIAALFPTRDHSSTLSTLCDDQLSCAHLDKPSFNLGQPVQPQVGPRYQPLNLFDATARLDALRRQMQHAKVDVYIVPTADAHGSEYVGEGDKRRAWLSGFTGSAGVAIVTRGSAGGGDRAFLFTDSRYHTQATHELDPTLWDLQKVGLKGVKDWIAWLAAGEDENGLPGGTRVGVDAEGVDFATAQTLTPLLHTRGLSLVYPSQGNLVDRVWGTDRPERKKGEIVDQPLGFAGKSAQDKLTDLRHWLETHYPPVEGSPTPSYLITSLPLLAWFLNLRGTDIAFNPFFYAYCLVGPGFLTLWVQENTGEVAKERIEKLGGEVRAYEMARADLKELGQRGERVVGEGTVNVGLTEALGSNFLPLPDSIPSPLLSAQALKNPTELQGFRNAYLRDGVAWVRWMAWLEETLARQQRTSKKKKRGEKGKEGTEVTEWEAAEKLTEFRREGAEFAGLAYENISASGENAALPHYAPSPDHPVPISLETPYLNDSGAQYRDGTIDTTRTYHFGLSPLLSHQSLLSSLLPSTSSPSKKYTEYQRSFTLVLQGHISLDTLIFPEGTTGEQIDVLARRALWSRGMEYGHGTGHGVGAFGTVHETQVGISRASRYFATPLLPGHVTSNEPAYYEPGHYGIRIESVLAVKEVETQRKMGSEEGKRWFGFERMTVVPIQSTLTLPHLLTPAEKKWLKNHNQECKDKLMPLLREKGDSRAVRWLRRQ